MRTIHNYRNLITPVINRILSRTIKCSKAHNLNASASVEGAIVIPLFIYAVMSIMFIMQVIAVRIHINNAFYVTLRKCAGYVYVYENSGNVPKGMVAETIRRLLIDEIGTDYAADHNIMGGNAGIMFMSSKILNNNSVIDIKLTYSIKNPFDIFGLSTIRVTDRKRVNAWLGEDKDNFAGNVSDKEYVYITAGGEVYHTNKECTYLLRYILEADYAADHNIMGGNAGIMFMSSKILNNNSVIDIKLTYSIKNPFDIFGLSTIRVTDRKRVNAWLGEDKDNFAGNVSDKEYVYITAGGEVYHTNKECTYLLRYILEADRSCMDVLRNASGAKYYSCEHCGQTKDTTSIYYTLYGTRYHSSRNCTELKRNIQKVSKDSVSDRRLCEKCQE